MRPLIVGAVLVGAAATGAEAQIVPFAGQTLACFSATAGGCTPTTGSFNSFYGNNTVTDLTGRIHFNTVPVSFTAMMGGPPVSYLMGKLSTGTQFSPGVPVPLDEYFTLAVALTNPPPAATSTFQGLVTGFLTFKGDPANPTVVLSFTGPGLNSTSGPHPISGGSYTLTANGGLYNSDTNYQPVTGTASVAATVTPEPVSMMLFGTGLGGLALLRRRRKKTAESADA